MTAEQDLESMTPEEYANYQKQNCIFCKMVSGEIPTSKVYEDGDFLGILDINPAKKGHVLLMPKKHFQVMPQMPPDLVGKIGVVAKKVSNKLLRGLHAGGTTVMIANGFAAGQKAPHFLIHVIPRDDADGLVISPALSAIPEKDYANAKQQIMLALKGGAASAAPRQAAVATNPKTQAPITSEPEDEEETPETKQETKHNTHEEQNKKLETSKNSEPEDLETEDNEDFEQEDTNKKVDLDRLTDLLAGKRQ